MYAIVPAAGESSRMQLGGQASPSKLFIPVIGETTLLELSLRSLAASKLIEGVVLIARAEDFAVASQILERVAFSGETSLVAGGATRQESVYNGLTALKSEPEFVLIHDGARPLCDPALMKNVVDEGQKSGAAILAVPVRSTLKRASSKQTVVKTLSRDNLWAAQTPQVFQYKLLLSAHEKAQKDEFTGTDDSELIEHLGREVSLVLGSQLNIKVTTPEDLHLIRAIVKHSDPALYPHLSNLR